jgi:hypothetical protein
MDLWSHALDADSFQDELNILMAFASMQRDGDQTPDSVLFLVRVRGYRNH